MVPARGVRAASACTRRSNRPRGASISPRQEARSDHRRYARRARNENIFQARGVLGKGRDAPWRKDGGGVRKNLLGVGRGGQRAEGHGEKSHPASEGGGTLKLFPNIPAQELSLGSEKVTR